MALLLTFSTAVQAQTPDGLTPAVETVCDVYEGALFGLCNAYCEAIDCGDPNVRAAERACSRIQANFVKHSGGSSIPQDCQKVDECPCFTTASITEIGGDCVLFDDDGNQFGDSVKETSYTTTEGQWVVYGDGTDGNCLSDSEDGEVFIDPISLDEANVCLATIVLAFEEAGGSCGS